MKNICAKKNRGALVVFTKTPGYLAPKTRLAKDIGSLQARRVHKAFFEHTEQLVQNIQGSMDVYWSCAEPEARTDSIWNEKKLIWDPADNLKMKVYSVVNRLLEVYPSVMVIGTDCPAMRREHIIQASLALESHNQVLGPTFDGGFYLFGSKQKLAVDCWEKTQWGQSQTARQVLSLFSPRQVQLLEPLSDVDTLEDFQRFLASTSGFQDLALATL